MSDADWLSASRLGLAGLLWPAALAGQGRVVGIGLVVAAITDVLDGLLARRQGTVSEHGARLDAFADVVIMLSAGCWLAILHPTLLAENSAWLAAVAVIYAVSTCASWLAFRRLVDPGQRTGKLAGGLLYGFALLTLLSGTAESLLLRIGLVALAASCAEALIRAMRTIQVKGIASSTRSHKPQASNGVASKAAPSASMTTSAAPASRQITP
jgi:phosphatidylglycerophosphate synthase